MCSEKCVVHHIHNFKKHPVEQGLRFKNMYNEIFFPEQIEKYIFCIFILRASTHSALNSFSTPLILCIFKACYKEHLSEQVLGPNSASSEIKIQTPIDRKVQDQPMGWG